MLKKVLLITVIGLFILSISSTIYAIGTPYGTRLTNTAIVTGANFSKISTGIGTNVQRIVGGHWVGEADANVSAGAVVTNTTYLTNLGNAFFAFRIRVTNFTAGGGAANWRWSIYTNNNFTTPYLENQYGNGSGEGGNLVIGSNVSKRIDLVVYVTNTATSGHYNEFRLKARVTNTKRNTDNYTGDNGIVYGGPIGEGWGDTIADALICYGPSSDNLWRVSIQAPNISITKSIQSILIGDASGPDNVAVPGATITYRIYVTNSGAGAANSVIIRDTLPSTNYISFVSGSTQLESGSASGFKFAYVSGANPVIYCSNLSTGALPANGRVSFTYQVTIK